MNKFARIGIVAVLVIVVGVLLVLKQNRPSPADIQREAVNSPGAQKTTDAPESASIEAQAISAPTAHLPRLLDLGADKCIPCKMMAPILEELKQEYQGLLKVEFIDVWENPDEAKKYDVKIIPTQIFYDPAGKELFRHEGFMSKEDILAKWKQLDFNME